MRALILLCLVAIASAEECDFSYDTLRADYMTFVKGAFGWDMDHYKAEWEKVYKEFNDYKNGFDAHCWETEKGKKYLAVTNSFIHKLEYFNHFDLEQKNVYFNPLSYECLKGMKQDVMKCDAVKYDGHHFDFCNDEVDNKFLECIKKSGEAHCDHDHFAKFYEMAKDAFKFSKDHHWCQSAHLFYGIIAAARD